MLLRRGERPVPSKTTAIAVILLLTAVGCGDPSRPIAPVELTGEFVLEQVDGRLLPPLVTFTGTQCVVTQSTLRLTAGGKWDWAWSCAEQPETHYGARDWFKQPAADSIAFPTNESTVPAYWGTGRFRGGLLEVSTLYPQSTDRRQPVFTVFGEHRWCLPPAVMRLVPRGTSTVG